MSPEIITLIISALIKWGPQAAQAIHDIFTKKEVTQEDWNKIWELTQKPWVPYVDKNQPPQ